MPRLTVRKVVLAELSAMIELLLEMMARSKATPLIMKIVRFIFLIYLDTSEQRYHAPRTISTGRVAVLGRRLHWHPQAR